MLQVELASAKRVVGHSGTSWTTGFLFVVDAVSVAHLFHRQTCNLSEYLQLPIALWLLLGNSKKACTACLPG